MLWILTFLCCWISSTERLWSASEPSSQTSNATLNWSPTIPIPLNTKGLCIFSDQGFFFIIHDLSVTVPEFDRISLWQSHHVIPHDKAVIHVLKPAIAFKLNITPQLDLALNPVLCSQPIKKHNRTISLQKSHNALLFKGIKHHKTIDFVHEGRRFRAILTNQIDEGFAHHIELRPYYRAVPSLQGLALQLDSDIIDIKSSSNTLTLTTPMPAYQDTAHHTFWTQLKQYENINHSEAISASPLCQAMKAFSQGDATGAIGILNMLKTDKPLMAYHPLVQTLLTWTDYWLGKPCQNSSLLKLKDAENWPGFYGDSPFCLAGFWENFEWAALPHALLKCIWEHAANEAHRCQSLPTLRGLLHPAIASYGIPLHYRFYQLVTSQIDEPHLFKEKLKNFLRMEVLEPSCPPEMSAWARYFSTDNKVAAWSPFVPLWQLHWDMEEAFKAKKYREVLAAIISSPFNPALSDVMKHILNQHDISHIEKLGLYEKFKASLPVDMGNNLVYDIITMWCDLDLTHQAQSLLVSHSSVLSKEARNRLWLSIIENHTAKKSWADAEYALKQISDESLGHIRTSILLQKAYVAWHTEQKDKAFDIWKQNTDPKIIEQSAQLLMESKNYQEAAQKWKLLVDLQNKEAIKPYAMCLWHIKDMVGLNILHQENPDNTWLEWLVHSQRTQTAELHHALTFAEATLQQVKDIEKKEIS